VGVKDTKLEADSKRVVLLKNDSGAVQELDVDWSKTGRARDLEAITPGRKRGNYLAVEGSSFGEHKARLFDLDVKASGGQANKSYVLPEFGQEIEGLVSLPQRDGSQTVLFGGRGDDKGQSTVFWGTLSDKGLEFSPEGLKGQKIDSPFLGEGQRSIADMTADKNGNVWAAGAVDEGDTGPFKSMVYKLGNLSGDPSKPLTPSTGNAAFIGGTKIEALIAQPNGSFLAGSDNEDLGGRFESFGIA
jgi:hypothetical protein